MPEQQAVQVVNDPIFINTDSGAVAIFGHELVCKKLLLVLAHCLALPDLGADSGGHGVHLVVFRDDGLPVDRNGSPLLGNCAPDTGSIAINLNRTFDVAMAEIREDTGEALWPCYWRNTILTVLHEIHHLNFLRGVDTYDEKLVDEEEVLAEEWGMQMLFELAKTVDIEPGNYMEFSHFSEYALEGLGVGDEGCPEEDAFCAEQKWMLDNGIMFHLPESEKGKEVTLYTFKEFCQAMANADGDPEWAKQTILGVGDVDSFEAKLREIDRTFREETPAVPVSADANTAYPDMDADMAEYMETPDPGDPNMAAFGGMMMGMHGSAQSFGNPMPGQGVDPRTIQPGDEVYYTKEYMDPNPMLNGGPAPFRPVSMPQPGQAPTNTMFPVAGQPTPAQPNVPPQQQGGFAVADQTGPSVDVYPKTGLSPHQTGQIVMGVYNKIYQHIFGLCGRKLNSDLGFEHPEMVCLKAIELSEQEKAVVVKCDCLDENGRWCPNTPTVNGIRGGITKNTKLPNYVLYINEDGQEKVRMLLPQNPGKVTNGQYTKPALQARGGSCIMYVMEKNDQVANATGKKFLLKCVDGTWQQC